MYADLEEARAKRARQISRTPELELERGSRRGERQSSDGYKSREQELADQLRQRALASRKPKPDMPRGRRSSVSSSETASRRSRSRSRSRSRDSRHSHYSRKSSHRTDADGSDAHRKRRRAYDDDHDSPRSRRRSLTLEQEADERSRERRRHREELNDREHNRHPRDRHDDRYRDRDNNDRRGDRYHTRAPRRHDDERRDVRRRSGHNSPVPSARSRRSPTPDTDDYEERSVFCTQLSVRLGQRDLGEFFEDRLGEGAVKDVRIVMDRITRRSKGVGYVEFAAKELVPKAIGLSGEVLFGVPIVVQITDAARNRAQQNGSSTGANPISAALLANVPHPMQHHSAAPAQGIAAGASRFGVPNAEARLYVGSLHFSLTDENVKSVFEAFGEIEYVDLHREPDTGKSKGFCFIQYVHPDGARKALEQMNGFELAGRTIRVGNVNAKGSGGMMTGSTALQSDNSHNSGHLPQLTSAFDDGGGAGLNPERRAALMEKLARNEPEPVVPVEQERPASIPQSISTSLLLKNMFDPEKESEPDWDKDLADDVKEECQNKYGPITHIHVEKDSAGEIYVTFADTVSSGKALQNLNCRFFGGKPISAQYIPDAFVKAKFG